MKSSTAGLACSIVAIALGAAAPLRAQSGTVASGGSTSQVEIVKAAEASIDPEKIRAHVRFLADDLLEGRGPGLRGSELAAKYIATQFALDGLTPGGDHGTYFQQVKFVGMKAIPAKTQLELDRGSGAPSHSPTATTTPSATVSSRPSLTLTRPSSSLAMVSKRQSSTGTTTPASTSRAR